MVPGSVRSFSAWFGRDGPGPPRVSPAARQEQGRAGGGAGPGAATPMRRRQVLKSGAVPAASLLTPQGARARAPRPPGPPSTSSKPPRDFRPAAATPTYFMDPDVGDVDPQFAG